MAHRTEKEETTEFKTKLNNPTPPQPSSQPLSLCSTTTTTCVNPTSTKPKTTSFSSQQITKKRDSSDLDLDSPAPMKKVVNRCFGCKRKIGLTGFKCRCGEMFCGEHRYSDRHDCSFDYKSAGREAIKRENPVVKASKIVRV